MPTRIEYVLVLCIIPILVTTASNQRMRNRSYMPPASAAVYDKIQQSPIVPNPGATGLAEMHYTI
jgi:hypothetical protein